MTTPVEVAFHGLDHSEAVETRVREKAAWLHKYFDRITHMRVVIDRPHRHHNKGSEFVIKIDVGMPGRANLIISREAGGDAKHENINAAVRDAFDAARRQLQGSADKMAGNVKTLRGPKHTTRSEE